jgi:uncharacterized protein
MKSIGLAVLSAIACFAYGTANAQVITLATTPAGSIGHSLSSAVAKVIVERAGMRATVTPQQSHGQEAVNDGSAEISLATISDVQQYVTGTGDWEGRGQKKDIRLISRLIPLLTVAYVRLDSDIKTLADVKGKRVGSDFPAHRAVRRVVLGQLAGAGLTEKDVRGVPTRNIITAADDFAAGKTDVFWMALGSAKVKQVAAAVGGLRALPIDASPEALKATAKWVPGSYSVTLKPSPQFEEIRETIPVLAYDMVLFTHVKQPADMVYKVAKAMHENPKDMAAVFAGMNRFQPNNMAASYEGIEYHPGAIKFFQEKGQWPPRPAGS